ncbi:MAG: hypothetical protein A3A86_07670 [Elusimicrobia bacterium RIFCSPLOWO2_01_FULL_60_11]|nr:MAG: hypothetical protein A3A86_07670 [Elusimicrobia bacterium RIFCSPLOWO2_01_FULL_60_11]
MKSLSRKKRIPKITTEEFDRKAEAGEDITDYFDWKTARVTIIKRVNIDFPDWMVKRLDQEAKKLNISRQAVVKMWVNDRLSRKAA